MTPYTIKEKVNITNTKISERLMKKIIWGKEEKALAEKKQELIDEAKRLTYERN